jgi:octaprenyl-diphosphate synthase
LALATPPSASKQTSEIPPAPSSAPLESPLNVVEIAKLLLEDALAPVVDDLHALNKNLAEYLPSESVSAKSVISHVLGAGGKRIRPALYFMCCRLFGYRGAHYLPIAAVAEFVHTASLLHDDVVDNSTLRRNKPAANSIWGDETSVLAGDLIYSTASEMMAATGIMEIVRTFARAIRLMSDGELLQLENLYNLEMSEAAYMRILECKTAALIEAACKSAGLLARTSEENIANLSKFGYCVGLAFQLIDDALDYSGSTEIVGKATLSDLQEGKITMPVILLRDKMSATEQKKLKKILSNDTVTLEDVKAVASLVERYDTVSLTIEKAHSYTHQAMACLHLLPASAERDDLENLANKLLCRFN